MYDSVSWVGDRFVYRTLDLDLKRTDLLNGVVESVCIIPRLENGIDATLHLIRAKNLVTTNFHYLIVMLK